MTKRKGIQIKKETYHELKDCRVYDGEPLTKVLERLINMYRGVI